MVSEGFLIGLMIINALHIIFRARVPVVLILKVCYNYHKMLTDKKMAICVISGKRIIVIHS